MYVSLFPEEGNLYKANMHCHTNISDGGNTPEEVKEGRRRGTARNRCGDG